MVSPIIPLSHYFMQGSGTTLNFAGMLALSASGIFPIILWSLFDISLDHTGMVSTCFITQYCCGTMLWVFWSLLGVSLAVGKLILKTLFVWLMFDNYPGPYFLFIPRMENHTNSSRCISCEISSLQRV